MIFEASTLVLSISILLVIPNLVLVCRAPHASEAGLVVDDFLNRFFKRFGDTVGDLGMSATITIVKMVVQMVWFVRSLGQGNLIVVGFFHPQLDRFSWI